MKLRPYQIQWIKDIYTCWHEGKRSVLAQMPTGGGKTICFTDIILRELSKGKRILLVTHRYFLIQQYLDTFQQFHCSAGVICAGFKPDPSKKLQIASIQTLNNREYPEADLVIIDEGHHAVATSYNGLWENYPNARFLGVTATPWRLDKEPLDNRYNFLVKSIQIMDLIDAGYLAKPKTYSIKLEDFDDFYIDTENENVEYDYNAIEPIFIKQENMSNILDAYLKYSKNSSAIVFATTIKHSISLTKRFNLAGIPAAHIDNNTPEKERKQIFTDFKNKKILILCNVVICTEGFDFPDCETVILARPTKSLSLYLQMAGRVMRVSPTKRNGIILDAAKLSINFDVVEAYRDWNLLVKKGLAETKSEILYSERKVREEESTADDLVFISDDIRISNTINQLKEKCYKSHYKIAWIYYRLQEYLVNNKLKLTKYEKDIFLDVLKRINDKAQVNYRFKHNFLFFAKQEKPLPIFDYETQEYLERAT